MNPENAPSPDFANRETSTTRLIDAPRERVFNAFCDPSLLARWWGPDGFRNTFHVFEFRVGGNWKFVMHGPDGTDYDNENVFEEIVEPERLVIHHVGWPEFHLFVSLTEREGKTAVTWRQCFALEKDFEKVKAICIAANEQNFNRLEAILQTPA